MPWCGLWVDTQSWGLLLVHGTSSLEVGGICFSYRPAVTQGLWCLCFSSLMPIHREESLRQIPHLIWVLLLGFSLKTDPTVSFFEVCRLTQRSRHIPGQGFQSLLPLFGDFWGSVRMIAFPEVLCWCAGALGADRLLCLTSYFLSLLVFLIPSPFFCSHGGFLELFHFNPPIYLNYEYMCVCMNHEYKCMYMFCCVYISFFPILVLFRREEKQKVCVCLTSWTKHPLSLIFIFKFCATLWRKVGQK